MFAAGGNELRSHRGPDIRVLLEIPVLVEVELVLRAGFGRIGLGWRQPAGFGAQVKELDLQQHHRFQRVVAGAFRLVAGEG